jgi:hypothetical protein
MMRPKQLMAGAAIAGAFTAVAMGAGTGTASAVSGPLARAGGQSAPPAFHNPIPAPLGGGGGGGGGGGHGGGGFGGGSHGGFGSGPGGPGGPNGPGGPGGPVDLDTLVDPVDITATVATTGAAPRPTTPTSTTTITTTTTATGAGSARGATTFAAASGVPVGRRTRTLGSGRAAATGLGQTTSPAGWTVDRRHSQLLGIRRNAFLGPTVQPVGLQPLRSLDPDVGGPPSPGR